MLTVYLFDIGNCLSQTRGTSVNVENVFFDIGNCLSQTRGTSVNVDSVFV